MALSDKYAGNTSLMTRSGLVRLINAALEVKAERFARQAGITWLAAYPGDLDVTRQLAAALIAEGKTEQAKRLLEKAITSDPEDIEAYKMLGRMDDDPKWRGALYALGETVATRYALPDWCRSVRESLKKLEQQKYQEAEALIHQALAADSGLALVDVVHLKINRAEQDWLAVRQLTELYQERWPDCLVFQYIAAEMRMESGDEAGAVSLLHECVTRDLAGKVAKQWMGAEHTYQPLWPEEPTIRFDLPIPAEVAFRLGMNHLPEVASVSVTAAEPISNPVELSVQAFASKADQGIEQVVASQKKTIQERDLGDLHAIKGEFEKLAKHLRKPAIGLADGRFPVYVILSSRTGLIQQYGQQSAEVLFAEMNHLAEVVRRRQGWGALAYLPDDPVCSSKFGLTALDNNDPWKIKLSLRDLDRALEHRGERIGALLIIGGEQIVPFHKLPNPTEDQDTEILSDNPYASTDGNYFVSEWLVGRLPGEVGADAGLLLQQMRQCLRFHEQRIIASNGWKKTLIYRAWQTWRNQRQFNKKNGGFGYSAAAWRRSSVAVFRPVAQPKNVHISPPDITGSINPKKVTTARLNYYNLHGVVDSAEWYGQRDINETGSGPDYPVALTIDDLQRNGKAPSVVFSEACYGGHVIGKAETQSIALRFLSIGVLGMVGSTCISYGSVSGQLVAADLLGQLFWKSLKEGYTAGEALMLAKINLIREMNRRQGYLDGEDQKTVLSFVLYGDPLASAELNVKQSKQALRLKVGLPIKTVNDHPLPAETPSVIQSEWIEYAKKSVETYLPGIEKSQVQLSLQRATEADPTISMEKNTKFRKKNQPASDRYVVTITKTIPSARRMHTHYARVTLDERGRIVKMAVSR